MNISRSDDTLNLAYMEPKSSSSLIENHEVLDTSMWLVNDEDETEIDDYYLDTTISIPRHAPFEPSSYMHSSGSETIATESTHSLDNSYLLNTTSQLHQPHPYESYDAAIRNEPIEYRNTSAIHNNTSIKVPTCRSLYKYLVKRVSKRLGHKKQSTAPLTQPNPEEVRAPIKVYAYNHKRASPVKVDTSNTTVAYVMHRRSNFFAGQAPQQPRDFVSPFGMKNFEWNRLNYGEFFSYDV